MTKTLLIIEDDQSTVRLLTITLQRKGYTIQAAANGLIGIEMARTNPPDAILLDLMLPGVDGFEVLDQLQNHPKTADIPVIVISAKGSPADRQQATELGVVTYLQKPYHIQKLYSVLKAAVGEDCVQPGSAHVKT